MHGYRLSARAAAAEARRPPALESKSYPPISWPGMMPGQQDGDNLRTGRITMEAANDGGVAARGAAIGLSATWACVNFWAGNIAALPLSVMRPGPGGVPVEDRTHPLSWLLHDSPNYDQSAYDFWEFMQASLELWGNAFAGMVRRDDGSVVALSPIAPNLVQVWRRSDGDIGYRWRDERGERECGSRGMLHIRGFGGSPLGGVSPLSACRLAFAGALAVDAAATKVFQNGARPSGTLSTEKILTADQRTDLETLLQEKFVGAVNAGRPMLLDGGLTWNALTINPHDAEMLETRRFGVEEVCRVFELDPHLVGQTVGNTMLGSSIESQTLSVLKFKLRKRLKRNEGALAKQLLTPAEVKAGVSVRYNLEAFLRADSAGRADFYEKMERYFTVNDVRRLEGLPPVAGGDVLYRQMQDIPIDSPAAPELPQ